jgi:hypothetical protein
MRTNARTDVSETREPHGILVPPARATDHSADLGGLSAFVEVASRFRTACEANSARLLPVGVTTL